MRSLKVTRIMLVCFTMIILLFTGLSHATVTWWGGIVDGGTLSVEPSITYTLPSTLSINPFFGLGITKGFDIYLQPVSFITSFTNIQYSGSWIMPRVEIFEKNIIALQVGIYGSTFTLSPQFHSVIQWFDKLSSIVNIGPVFTLASGIEGQTTLVGGFSLDFTLNEIVGLFSDFSASYLIGTTVYTLGIIPGVFFNLPIGTLSAGVSITPIPSTSIGIIFYLVSPVKIF